MHKGFEKYWSKLKNYFRLLLGASIAMPTVSAVLILLALRNIFQFGIPLPFWIVYILSISGLSFLWNSKARWGNKKLIDFLHQEYPQLEFSLSIFFKKGLNEIEELQQKTIYKQLPEVRKLSFPLSLKRWLILLNVSVLFFLSSFYLELKNPVKDENIVVQKEVNIEFDQESSDRKKFSYQLWIDPPNYTGLRSFSWKENQKIPEGSIITFKNTGEQNFELLWQNQYEFNISPTKQKSIKLKQSSFYQIHYLVGDSTNSTRPIVLETIADKSPELSTSLKENRHEIDWQDSNQPFGVDLSIKDDYGILSADIIMTLSRGEGESVKFREMKQPIKLSSSLKKLNLELDIPLDTFSLEPGDELYFYFTAYDNSEPAPNQGRTDVYFLTVNDTVEFDPVEYEGFALTNEAEYFKSQRQIIIDTEKLLTDQAGIPREEFEQRSNSIGADQKLLRLRYGVFLGEEYETTGGLGEVDHSGHDHVSIKQEDESKDDHEDHEHETESKFSNPIYNETPELEAYVHAHDESELSTFLDANVKAKLKEALANMWEAELFLRTYKPKQALPYEYKALKLIKEVKRASRIYVERMGFEPPAIDKDQKRLTGDLEDIEAETTEDQKGEESFEEKLLETYTVLNTAYNENDLQSAKQRLSTFANVLVEQIASQPVRFAKLLSEVKDFQSAKSINKLRPILIRMEDMLRLKDIESGVPATATENSLIKMYYELQNE